MTERRQTTDQQWLTPPQLETWKALTLVLRRLPGVLGRQLQCDSGLSLIEYYVLAALSDQPQHTLRLSELAVMSHSELSRLSHLVTRLEKRGLVRRQPDPTDGRFTNAILTDQGFAHLVEAAPGHVDLVRSLVFEPLDDQSQRALGDAVAAIVHQLDANEDASNCDDQNAAG